MKPSIEIHNLTVSYDRRPVLWDIDFTIPQGQLIGVIGPNGSGKTTLLKSIMDLIPTNSGYVKLFDRALSEVRHRVSYVPQRESVDWDFPINVLEVVEMGRYSQRNIFGRLSKADKTIAKEALAKVGMQDFADRQISQLSGGQQQRVFIARALAQQADLYLMDEPFAGVDAASEAAILELLAGLKADGKTVLIVHHDLQTASEFFDWMVLLNTRLVAAGPIETVFTPEYLQEAYGGKLTILSQVAERVKERGFPVREKKMKERS